MNSYDVIRAVMRGPSVDEGNTLVGHAAVFDSWTEINSHEGHFVERFAPGAFSKTLKERGDRVKVLFNHGMDPSIGDKPLGKPSILREDGNGLYAEVPLAETSYNADIRGMLESGALDGMSVRFRVINEDVEEMPQRSDNNPTGLPERTIREAQLYEFGPVTFPAYEAATAGIRSRSAYELWRNMPDEERNKLFGLGAGIATPSNEPPSGTPTLTKPQLLLKIRDLKEIAI